MTEQHHFDVIIVGAGVMGSAIAYFLTRDPLTAPSVLVVDADPVFEKGATGRSWGGFRQQFSTHGNQKMSQFGVEFFRKSAEYLSVDGTAPDLTFREQGYLFLGDNSNFPNLVALRERQRSWGVELKKFDNTGLASGFPWLNNEDLAGGIFGPKDEGWIDPNSLRLGFRKKAQNQGASFEIARIAEINRQNGRITSVTIGDDNNGKRKRSCDYLVNAAGPWAGQVARLAGAVLPVEPRKRMTYVFRCPEDLQHIPLTIDISGLAFRPEGGQYLAILSPPENADPPGEDFTLDYEPFENVIWPLLAHRVPAFERIKLTSAWAGLYDFNSLDQNAVIGTHPEIDGLIFCNGFSGHGLQQSPAAGRAVAELILHGKFQTLDLSSFGYERILKNESYTEDRII